VAKHFAENAMLTSVRVVRPFQVQARVNVAMRKTALKPRPDTKRDVKKKGVDADLKVRITGVPSRRLKRLDCLALVFLDVEHSVKLGDLQQVVDVLAEVHKLELTALITNGGVATHQLTHACAVDVAHIGQIEQYVLVVLAHQIANQITNHVGSFAQP
jgi:hypothetical protein